MLSLSYSRIGNEFVEMGIISAGKIIFELLCFSIDLSSFMKFKRNLGTDIL